MRAALTLRILQRRKERAAPLASHWLQRLDLKESKRADAKGSQSLFYFSIQLDPLSMVLIKRIIYLIAWNHPENSLSPSVLHYLAWLPGEAVMSC